MRANPSEQQALISILNRIYGEIRMIEEQHGIIAGAPDYRPRIEYYHDAIRALTSGSDNVYAAGGRLSVEYLAFDLSSLRHIQSAPLGELKPPMPSLATQVMKQSQSLSPAVSRKNTMDRATRQQMMDLYKNYTVLFAALLAESADRNYQSRIDDLNTGVEELAMLEALLKGQASEASIENAVMHMENEDLRLRITALLHRRAQKRIAMEEDALQLVSETIAAHDRQIASIEAAHFTYATSQLAVYEESRDVVKKMVVSGMNIAGQFVESAMQEARRTSGRGR